MSPMPAAVPLQPRPQALAAKRARSFQPPTVERVLLPGGLQAILTVQRDLPVAALQLAFPAGSLHDPPGLEGLASVTTPLLRTGTHRLGSHEIAEATEELGIDLLTGADWELGVLMIDFLAEDLDFALDLLVELAWSPAFPAAAFDQTRGRRVHSLRQRRLHGRASGLADDAFCRAVYGDTGYGRPEHGTDLTLASVEREDIIAFHRMHFTQPGACLIGAGSFDPERLLDRLATALPPSAGPAPPPADHDYQPLTAMRVVVIDDPTGGDTEIRIGHAGLPRNHPDFVALQALTALLGGTTTSRLSLQLRERMGCTYEVRCHLVGRAGPGPLLVEAAVASEHAGAAVRTILAEIERLRETALPEDEVDLVRSYLAGSYPQSFKSNNDLLQKLRQLVVDDQPEDFFVRQLEQIATLEPRRLLEVARYHLHPESTAIVAVGPAVQVARQLTGIGELVVIDRASARSVDDLPELKATAEAAT